MKVALRVLACGSFFVVTLVSAQTIVTDQSFVPSSSIGSYGIDGSHSRAQTFTVGVGGILSSIDVDVVGINSSESVLWDLRPTSGGVPAASNTNTLASGNIMSSALPQGSFSFYSIDVSSFNIAATPGDVYAIAFRGTSGNTVLSWRVSTAGGYAGGSFFDGSPSGGNINWSSLSPTDAGFDTKVLLIPEPAYVGLCGGIAALALAWSRRFRGLVCQN